MALLQNPSFESSVAPWTPVYIPDAVGLQILGGDFPRSGKSVLAAQTNVSGASFGQDFSTDAPSVFAFLWVRSWNTPVAATFALWDLDAGSNITTNFTATPEWSLVTNTFAPSNPGAVRFEIYLHTINAYLFVDSANAF